MLKRSTSSNSKLIGKTYIGRQSTIWRFHLGAKVGGYVGPYVSAHVGAYVVADVSVHVGEHVSVHVGSHVFETMYGKVLDLWL